MAVFWWASSSGLCNAFARDLKSSFLPRLNSSPESESDCAHDTHERCDIVPPRRFSQIGISKNREHDQRYDLLNDLQLVRGELRVPDPICRNLKAVLGKRNQPAHDNDQE